MEYERLKMVPAVQLATGHYFNFLTPDESLEEMGHAMALVNIAQGLSRICRFNGHVNTRTIYSVGEHSVRMVDLVETPAQKYAALLHDAQEALIGDISSPLKQLLPDYQLIEQDIEHALWRFFEVPLFDPEIKAAIRHADLRMLATERRDLCQPLHLRDTSGDRWSMLDGIEPAPFEIEPWEPDTAFLAFSRAFAQTAPESLQIKMKAQIDAAQEAFMQEDDQ